MRRKERSKMISYTFQEKEMSNDQLIQFLALIIDINRGGKFITEKGNERETPNDFVFTFNSCWEFRAIPF